MLIKPLIAVIVLLSALMLYAVAPAIMGPAPAGQILQPFGDQYSDLGDFSEMVKGLSASAVVGSTAQYDVKTLVGSPAVLSGVANPQGTVYFAAGVSRDYRAEEVQALIDYTKRGGRLLIADDFGYGNTLAQKFGIFFFGTDLWDLEDGRYDKNISLPLIPFVFAGTRFTIELNGPTGITLIQNTEINTTVIAHCSDKCYADIDRSGTVNIGDKKGNISVIMRAQIQKNVTVEGVSTYEPTLGEAYFISDASVFSNEMLAKPDDSSATGNRAFAQALITTMLPEGGTVIIDESRHLHDAGTQVVYTSFESAAVATSRVELALALIGGAALGMAIIVLRAKDREAWIHHFDLSYFRPRAHLPDTLPVQVDRLRSAARSKIIMTHSMADEEFVALTMDQQRAMIKDPMLIDLLLNPGRQWAGEEARALADHIRVWGK